jgi:hypothetical protein
MEMRHFTVHEMEHERKKKKCKSQEMSRIHTAAGLETGTDYTLRTLEKYCYSLHL